MTDARIILAAFCLGLAAAVWLALARTRLVWRLSLTAACLLAGLAGVRLDTAAGGAGSMPAEVPGSVDIAVPAVTRGQPTPPPPVAPMSLRPSPANTSSPVLALAPEGDTRLPAVEPGPAGVLVIPDLGVEAAILPVRIHDGAWDVSGLGKQVGWLETTGARPGDSLAMALAGHATVTAAQAGAFARLWKLRLEAEVIYRAPEGDYRYLVYDKRELVPDEVQPLYLADGEVLQLVTCAVWDPQTRDYTRRLLVRARLVSAPVTEQEPMFPSTR